MEVDEVADMVMDMEVNTVADKAANMVMKLPFITIIIVVIIVTVKHRFFTFRERARTGGWEHNHAEL